MEKTQLFQWHRQDIMVILKSTVPGKLKRVIFAFLLIPIGH